MNTFLCRLRNSIVVFFFFLIQSTKSTNIENRVQVRPILYSTQPIILQIFSLVSNKKIKIENFIDEDLEKKSSDESDGEADNDSHDETKSDNEKDNDESK